jgi:uncharacterized OB-fold protein
MDRVIPDPIPTPETEIFWAAAKEGRFLVRQCNGCGKVHWYPRAICPFCASCDTTWIDGSGRGTIYSYSIMRRASPPYVMAYVELEEGPRMMTNIVDADVDGIAIGQSVELTFRQSEGGFSVPMFRPA